MALPRATTSFAGPGGRAVRLLDTAAGRIIIEATPRGIARLEQVGPEVGIDEVGPDQPGTWFDVKHFDDDDNQDNDDDDNPDNDDDTDDDEVRDPDPGAAAGLLARLADQLEAYLAGERREFDVPVDWAAAGVHDEFSREAYREIQHIPYGETSSYGQISIDAGRPRNARRVGRLCTLVPVPFVIPVHRVIRADGGMGNCPEYRLRLLEHERRNLAAADPIAFA
ncbi:methylated-DNA--[protein]-cysteine S-methyltransferase [Rhodococcus sp. IEGM 1408]|uniref:methylated-DNA--[protein]-cysteine S-methyltransferase n=1 Tax=Rhodococcus sp. IEGM 1408 TaxID=3082220 RepID=UPI002954AA3F|nr:methylated-DNA--[protein]-cysteine S-methyltransferase [Rhodococcus sp. IEGM 1408]MDV8001642.1 methylated-DNA--[protein]-cysteine S-methyltransferase [Rhodococcus sp. IEGM 1408]